MHINMMQELDKVPPTYLPSEVTTSYRPYNRMNDPTSLNPLRFLLCGGWPPPHPLDVKDPHP